MSEPFFDFIAANRQTVSNNLYGFEEREKRYHKKNYVLLPETPVPATTLVDALHARKTVRDFSADPLSLQLLSSILRSSLARNDASQGVKQYPFPSGGGFYPIETYLLIQNVSGLEAGLYHYATVDHSVAYLGEGPQFSLQELNDMHGCPFNGMPHVVVHMTMVKSRTIHKYGSLSYALSFIEAGHRGQNIYLSAAAHELGVCAMGGSNYANINKYLDVDGVNEHYIYGLALGLPASLAR